MKWLAWSTTTTAVYAIEIEKERRNRDRGERGDREIEWRDGGEKVRRGNE